MNPKYLIKKTISLGLIFSSIIQLGNSIREILFILPYTSYQMLVKKAIITSAGLFVDFFYGFSLFIMPLAATKAIHLILGGLIFVLSFFLFF